MKKLNKDFQSILILGIISIIISGLALYSFKDIKFKNTKKLQEENIKQQEIQQELGQKYQELINNKKNNTEDNKQQKLITTGEISILMPKFFMNESFQKLGEQLTNQNINVSYNYVNSMSEYQKMILSGLITYDIYLIPTNWTQGLELNTINIGENPKPYFHRAFQDLITINNNKYIPYSIDPLIILHKSNTNIENTRESIFSYSTLWKQEKTRSMPIIRGIGKNDIRLLENGSGPFQNYLEILYNHIIEIIGKNEQSNLTNMLNLEKLNLQYKYNFADFKKLYTTIQKRDTNCNLYPAICLMSYNLGNIKFGFLSDLDVLNTYFSGNKNLFEIQEFNNADTHYPTRGRAFVVQKNDKNINLANKFLQQYIAQGVDNNTGLWNNTLSAINNIYNTQKQSPKYKNIIKYEDNFVLINDNISKQLDFLKNTNTIKMLKGDYSPEIYLKNQ